MQPRKLISGMQPYFDPSRWNVEDHLNIFENGRRPQFLDVVASLVVTMSVTD